MFCDFGAVIVFLMCCGQPFFDALDAKKSGRARRVRPLEMTVRGSAVGLEPLAVGDLPLVDAERESTIRVHADPGLVENGCAVGAVVGERNESAVIALHALGIL